jgi:hypothetical protein
MYAYAVIAMDRNEAYNVELCFGIYLDEKKAFAVVKDLNAKAKEINILKHSENTEENRKELEKLTNKYEQILRDKFIDKNSIGVFYYHESSNLYWDVKQIAIVE